MDNREWSQTIDKALFALCKIVEAAVAAGYEPSDGHKRAFMAAMDALEADDGEQ